LRGGSGATTGQNSTPIRADQQHIAALRLAAGRRDSSFRASLLLRRTSRRAMRRGHPRSGGSKGLVAILGVLPMLASPVLAQDIPLNRDPGAYFVLAMRSMGVFNL